LVKPLPTGFGVISSRAGYFIRLVDEEGRCGHGEATPLAEFGTEDRVSCERALGRGLEDLIAAGSLSLEEALALISKSGAGAPCARAALDSALHDLAAQAAQRPLSFWLHTRAGLPGRPSSRVAVQAIVGGDDAESVHASAKRLVADGFEAFKLKLATVAGSRELASDLERVAALRETVGPGRRIRLDANEAWTLTEAVSALSSLERFDIDFVEQPVARGDPAALKELDQSGAVPVAADEALLGSPAAGTPAWSECLEARSASIFVVKPAALGGIEPALALAARARSLDIRVIWSSLIDGAVSRAAAVALAAGLGAEGEVHGLGTAGLLARDLVEPAIEGADREAGSIRLSDSNGLDWRVDDLVAERNEIWGPLRLFGSRS
jgi:o-succinylbenzoate synthase